MSLQHRLLTLLTTCLLANAAWSSALFDGNAANLWLVDTESGQVTSYSFGDWLSDYQTAQSEITLPSGFQALVNQLPNSSVPMSASQPGVSVIGLSPAAFDLGNNDGPALLRVTPLSGLYQETIGVSLLVEPRQLDAGNLSLWWRINQGAWRSRTLTQADRDAAGRGYIEHRLYVIRDGEHRLDVELRDGVSVLASQARLYEMASTHPDGELRDTDGDGLPDLVEQAIGLNPLTSDLDEPSHLDDWTRFDLWLRCDQEELADCTEPMDTDKDGWTDWDEQWRGTRHDDVQVTNFLVAPESGSDEERRLIRRYKEFPTARRLYEIEYQIGVASMSLTPDQLTAATLYGAAGWQLSDLVSQADLDNAALTANDVAPGRLKALAEQALANGDWPMIRLPAGDAAFIRADQIMGVGEGQARKEALLYLPPQQDLAPAVFRVEEYGIWSTAEEWKAHYRSWLQDELVRPIGPSFTDAESRSLLAFEFLLVQEARLREINASFKLGVPGAPLAWVRDLKAALAYRSPGATLSQLIQGLQHELQPGALLGDDALQIDVWLANLAAGSHSQGWLAQKLMFSQAGEDIGCFITQSDWDSLNQIGNEDLLQQFQDECPNHHTSTDLANWQKDSLDRRYRLRLMMLAEGAMRLSNDASLAVAGNDSDGDNLTNGDEILLRPYRWHTLPWMADTDTDGYADGEDICPLDPFNRCTGVPEENRLYLGNDLTVSKPLSEGTVLLSLQLDRPAERPVTIDYQVWSGPEDSGVDGLDFIADIGQVVIQPGQTTILVPVTLLGGGSGEQFRLEVTAVDGAEIQGANVTLVALTEYVALAPVANVMSSNLSVNEMQSLTLDASLSYDPAGTALSFDWQANPALGQTLNFTSTSGFAELTAPNLVADTPLLVTVTVTNEALLSDDATITVLVVAEDEAPTILGTPLYSMDVQSVLIIPLSELAAYVEDPEGGPISFDSVLAQPQGVLAYLTDSDLVLDGAAATLEAVGLHRIQNNSVVLWRQRGFAFFTVSTVSDPERLYGWHPDSGLELLHTAEPDESLASLIYDAALDRLYFDRIMDGARMVSWLDANKSLGEVFVASVFSGTSGRQINSFAKGLYLCNRNTLMWVYMDTLAGNVQTSDKACTLSDKKVQTSRQACVQSGDTLWCTEPDSTDPALVSAFSFGLNLITLDAVQDTFLFVFEDIGSASSYLFYYTPGGGLPENLITWPQLNLPHNLVIRDQTVTLAVGLNQLTLYRWQPGGTLAQFTSAFTIDPGEALYQPPTFITEDAVLGLVRTNASSHKVYRFDLTSETFETLIELGPDSTPIASYGYDLELSPRGLMVASYFGDGQCYWQRLNSVGTLDDVYLDNAPCLDRLVTPDVEVHLNYNDMEGRYYRVTGGDFMGQTMLQLSVSDEAGNSAILPIELDVVEGP